MYAWDSAVKATAVRSKAMPDRRIVGYNEAWIDTTLTAVVGRDKAGSDNQQIGRVTKMTFYDRDPDQGCPAPSAVLTVKEHFQNAHAPGIDDVCVEIQGLKVLEMSLLRIQGERDAAQKHLDRFHQKMKKTYTHDGLIQELNSFAQDMRDIRATKTPTPRGLTRIP